MKTVDAYSAKKKGAIMLNANELYQTISADIQQEIIEEVKGIDFHRYPDETNMELCTAYATHMHLDSQQLLAGNGSDEMLGLMIGYFLGKDKKLFTLAPDFSMYDYYASMHEASVIKYPCREDGSFDIDDFIETGRRQTIHMILFSNPNNPTGHALCTKELCKIIEAFPSIPVIIDEAYAEFAQDSMLSKLDCYPNLYVTRTLSKAYGLAGMRLGFLLSSLPNIKKLRPMMVPYNISSITQKVGVVVLRHATAYTNVINEIIVARDALYEQVKDFTKMTMYPSKANYLYGRSPYKKELLEAFEQHGVIIRTYADDSFRITIGAKEENDIVCDILTSFEKEACIV